MDMDELMDPVYGNLQSAVTLPNHTSYDNSKCDSFIYNPYVAPALYFAMVPVALLLNGVAAWVCLHLRSTSTFVVYLKNLVAADLIMTLVIPIKATSNLLGKSSVLAVLSCRYFSTIIYSTQYTCIALLGIIGLDRFFKIMIPQNKLLCHNLTCSRLISASVWLLLFGGAALPNIIFTDKSVANVTNVVTCMMLKGPAGLELHHRIVIYLNVFFWLVCVVVAVCYICIANKVIRSFKNSGSKNSQGKQRIKLRVFLVVVVFFVSFVPYHIVRIPYTFAQVNYSSSTCSYLKSKFAKDISLWLANTNICMDPLLYVFLCREFKEKLVYMLENVVMSFKVESSDKAEAT